MRQAIKQYGCYNKYVTVFGHWSISHLQKIDLDQSQNLLDDPSIASFIMESLLYNEFSGGGGKPVFREKTTKQPIVWGKGYYIANLFRGKYNYIASFPW